MWQQHRTTILLVTGLLLIYFGLFSCSTRGYGYMCHNGYDSGPSSFY